ncbi:MAG: S8 family serine peptidase [Catenulisporales bacterium]|nr:S8 family serine peptidase [Catenulisporales bacterium]
MAVSALAAGCFLASASAVRAGGTSGAPPAGGGRCPRPLPAPNLPAGDPGPGLLWPQSQLGLSSAGVWYLTRGKGVTVAVVDTGVDKTNPAFGPDTVLAGSSVVDPGDRADDDCDGHGTAIAAVVAGRENGVFGFSGAAPEATILPIRQTYLAGQPGRGSSVKLANAIRTATAGGARIIDVSIATTEDSPQLRAAVQNALASDVLIVAPAGADGPAAAAGAQKDVKYYPAAIPGVLAVGAVDRTGRIATSFAQQDAGVMLAAPGGRMAVPAAGFPGALTAEQGTGFASAFVAGTAALVLAHRPGLHNWQVAQRLVQTADRPSADASGDNGDAGAVAWGIVDPYRAVTVNLAGEGRPDPSLGPGTRVVEPEGAAPGRDRLAEHLALGVAGCGVLAVAVPVVTVAARRGRIRGTRAGA